MADFHPYAKTIDQAVVAKYNEEQRKGTLKVG